MCFCSTRLEKLTLGWVRDSKRFTYTRHQLHRIQESVVVTVVCKCKRCVSRVGGMAGCLRFLSPFSALSFSYYFSSILSPPQTTGWSMAEWKEFLFDGWCVWLDIRPSKPTQSPIFPFQGLPALGKNFSLFLFSKLWKCSHPLSHPLDIYGSSVALL